MMPNHEAVLNYQMYEMHRFYGRQRELMDGIQMNKPPAYCFMPQVPKQQNMPFMAQVPKQQNMPFMAQVPKQQNMPFMAQVPKQQSIPFVSQVPQQQHLPFVSQVPQQHNLLFMSQVPKQQNLPFTPQVPKQLNLPFIPQVPNQQNLPSCLLPGSQCGERQGVENFRSPSAFVPVNLNHVSFGHHHGTVERDFKPPESSSLGRNKFGKRMLDLELPAEVYLDSDDEKQVEEKRIPQIHPVLHSPLVNHVATSREGTSVNSSSSYQRRQCVFDLNEPAKEDEVIVYKSTMPSTMIGGNIKLEENGVLEETGKPFASGHQLLGKKLPFSSNERAGLGSSEVSKNEHTLVDSRKRRCLKPPMVADGKRSFDKPKDGPRVIVQALPCSSSPLNWISSSSGRRVGIKQKKKVGYRSVRRSGSRFSSAVKSSDGKKARMDLNLNDMPLDFSPETEACQESFEFSNGRFILDLNAVPACCSSETGISDEHDDLDKSEFGGKMIDLNAKLLELNTSSSQLSALTSVTSPSSSSESEHAQKHEKSAIPAVVAMPCDSSHDVKNCCNDEKVKETDKTLSENRKDKEPETVAAEIIISMSLSEEQHCLKNSLNWFAEIVLREAKTFKSPGPSLRKRGRRARNAGQKVEFQPRVASRNRTLATRKPRAAKGGGNVDFAKTGEGRGKRAVAVQKVRSGLKQQLVKQSWLFVWGKRSRRQKHKRV